MKADNRVKTKALSMVTGLLEAGKPPKGTPPEAAPAQEPANTESYPPQVAAVLKKYHILNADGSPRMVALEKNQHKETANAKKVRQSSQQAAPSPKLTPILDPDVITKFASLDTTKNKRLLDWMLFAAGGGENARRASEKVFEQSHQWVVDNRMKGFGRDHDPDEGVEDVIKPMSKEEAEADWDQNSREEFYVDCFYADEDFAADPTYPVFGYFQTWPGRDGVYQKVESGVNQFLAIVGNKKLLADYNKFNAKTPFQTNLWNEDGSPRFKDIDALITACGEFKASFARRRGEQNVQFIGRDPENPKGGFVRGSDTKLYSDDYVDVFVPATAAASMKTGAPNWCVANKSRWEEYFRTRSKSSLNWGGYTERGPFVYWHVKVPVKDKHLQKIAGHMKASSPDRVPEAVEFWDIQNNQAIAWHSLRARLQAESPELVQSFEESLKPVQDWMKSYKHGKDVEHYPALESKKKAEELVNSMLG